KCTDSVVIFRNDGSRTFSIKEVHPISSFPNSIATADFNADGRADLALACYHSNDCAVLLQRDPILGGDSFAAPPFVGVGTEHYVLAVGDVDGDSHVDIVAPNREGDDISTVLNLGNSP